LIKPIGKKTLDYQEVYTINPFYRELRNADGVVQPNVKAQRSMHIVLQMITVLPCGHVLLNSYQKYIIKMTDVNTYTIDNVRIRYAASNTAKAYAQGIDLRLNGEFVPGTESWLSVGYLKLKKIVPIAFYCKDLLIND
jgi:hypothetical protein